MATEVITITAILSILICVAVSREAVKPKGKVKWKKMIPLLSAGTITLIITISLFQSLSFFR